MKFNCVFSLQLGIHVCARLIYITGRLPTACLVCALNPPVFVKGQLYFKGTFTAPSGPSTSAVHLLFRLQGAPSPPWCRKHPAPANAQLSLPWNLGKRCLLVTVPTTLAENKSLRLTQGGNAAQAALS